MKVPKFDRPAEGAPVSLEDALAELAAEVRSIARSGGRVVLAYLDELLSEKEAARLLGVSACSLRSWACRGCGPRRVAVGSGRRGRAFYRRGDLLAWIEQRTVEPRRDAPRRYRRRAAALQGTRHQVAAVGACEAPS